MLSHLAVKMHLFHNPFLYLMDHQHNMQQVFQSFLMNQLHHQMQLQFLV